MCVFRSHLWLRHRFLRRRSSLIKNEYGVAAAAAVCRRKAHYLAPGNALAALMRKQIKNAPAALNCTSWNSSFTKKKLFGYELLMQ
jgi:hypothetical protein